MVALLMVSVNLLAGEYSDIFQFNYEYKYGGVTTMRFRLTMSSPHLEMTCGRWTQTGNIEEDTSHETRNDYRGYVGKVRAGETIDITYEWLDCKGDLDKDKIDMFVLFGDFGYGGGLGQAADTSKWVGKLPSIKYRLVVPELSTLTRWLDELGFMTE